MFSNNQHLRNLPPKPSNPTRRPHPHPSGRSLPRGSSRYPSSSSAYQSSGLLRNEGPTSEAEDRDLNEGGTRLHSVPTVAPATAISATDHGRSGQRPKSMTHFPSRDNKNTSLPNPNSRLAEPLSYRQPTRPVAKGSNAIPLVASNTRFKRDNAQHPTSQWQQRPSPHSRLAPTHHRRHRGSENSPDTLPNPAEFEQRTATSSSYPQLEHEATRPFPPPPALLDQSDSPSLPISTSSQCADSYNSSSLRKRRRLDGEPQNLKSDECNEVLSTKMSNPSLLPSCSSPETQLQQTPNDRIVKLEQLPSPQPRLLLSLALDTSTSVSPNQSPPTPSGIVKMESKEEGEPDGNFTSSPGGAHPTSSGTFFVPMIPACEHWRPGMIEARKSWKELHIELLRHEGKQVVRTLIRPDGMALDWVLASVADALGIHFCPPPPPSQFTPQNLLADGWDMVHPTEKLLFMQNDDGQPPQSLMHSGMPIPESLNHTFGPILSTVSEIDGPDFTMRTASKTGNANRTPIYQVMDSYDRSDEARIADELFQMASDDDEEVADGAVATASRLLDGKTVISSQLQPLEYLPVRVTDKNLRPLRTQSPRQLQGRDTSLANVALPVYADTIGTESYLFLMQYFRLFDTNRLALYSAYMKDATFSYQVNGALPDRRDDHSLGVTPFASDVGLRNLKRQEKEAGRSGVIRVGPRAIIDELMTMETFVHGSPIATYPTQEGHFSGMEGEPVVKRERFVWNAMQLPSAVFNGLAGSKRSKPRTSDSLIIVCHGDLTNPTAQPTRALSYHRSFILRRNTQHEAALDYWPWQIACDQLTLRKWTSNTPWTEADSL